MRREAVKISAETQSTNGIQFPAEVEAFESDFVHQNQIAYIRMGRFNFSGLCPMDMNLQVGQLVYAEVDPERLCFFDTVSGLRF